MINILVKLQKIYILGVLARFILIILGVEIPKEVEIGKEVKFVHNAPGTVIHKNTKIGNNVKIYQGVTIGRADIYVEFEKSSMGKIIIEEGCILCAGAKIICREEILKIRKNTIIGANAVLNKSTGENEIWGGIPAKKIKKRNFK